jgi:arabinogalactan endo-1,4-beta-galactosidase
MGADLSYVNEMEDCGAVYTVGGTQLDPYAILKDRGCNLVRLRLWHTPSWYDQLNQGHRYGDLADVILSISRAKSLGMKVQLDFHLSDTWADPGHQVVPAAWAAVVNNQAVLEDSLHNYILNTLSRLGDLGLLPDIVQIGNETNRGILLSQATNDQGWTLDWNRNVALFEAALSAIEESAQAYSATIQSAIHIADPGDVEWYVEQFTSNGFTGYDIIGISYYWQWHQPVTIAQMGQVISRLKQNYPGKEVMIFETAYGWTTQNADAANNILYNTASGYAPLSPANQKNWMTDLTQVVIDNGGKGVIYWEPAWVSTSCATQWVQGSSWDNATFFDFNNELIADGGIGWMAYPYEFTSATDNVPAEARQLDLSYVDGEIQIRNTGSLHLKFPCTIVLYAADGKVTLSRKITFEDEQMIGIAAPGLLPGCYMVSLKDKALVGTTGMICIINP